MATTARRALFTSITLTLLASGLALAGGGAPPKSPSGGRGQPPPPPPAQPRFKQGGAPVYRGALMPAVDREAVARAQLGDAFARSTQEREGILAACISAALTRGEPIAQEAWITWRIDDHGGAHPTSLRMVGRHSTALADCFWREISTWRYADLMPVNLDVEARMTLLAQSPPAPAPAASPLGPAMDRARGRVALLTPPAAFGEAWAAWYPPMSAWSADLSTCFEEAWRTRGFSCDGALELPIEVDEAGVATAGAPAFWEAPSQEGDGGGGEAADAREPPPADASPLGPRCPPEVARCLQDSVAIWQLPEAPEGGAILLQLRVDPPHRLDEAPAPEGWPSTAMAPLGEGLPAAPLTPGAPSPSNP